MGRKGKYFTHVEPYLEEIKEWYQYLTEEEIAVNKLHISVSSFENYKKQHSELREALKNARAELILELKEALKKKAKGFHYKETKKTIRSVGGVKTQVVEEYEKYSPPDTGAIHLLLKNLDDSWRNDDAETMQLKRDRIELDKQKAEDAAW